MSQAGEAGSPPGPVLVTGGTGFVGGAVVRALAARGYPVRLLIRDPGRARPELPGEPRRGDVTDLASVAAAVAGCWGVVHCAADYRLSLAPGDTSRLIATNVGGTRNVLLAAGAAGVARLVHCSSVGTLAFDRSGRVRDERDLAPSADSLAGPYKRSKWAAERLALGGGELFPQAVVVSPSTPVGRGDRRPTPTGEIIRDFLAGRIPAVVSTGLNLVDVEAVGRGHVLALERGRPGRSYILGDRNLTLSQLLSEVARISGRRPPNWRLPLAAAYGAALWSELLARHRGGPPSIPLTSVRMAGHPMYVDATRARLELGWDPGDLDRALTEAVEEAGAVLRAA